LIRAVFSDAAPPFGLANVVDFHGIVLRHSSFGLRPRFFGLDCLAGAHGAVVCEASSDVLGYM